MSVNRFLLCLLVTSLLLPAVSAGTQEDPEIEDGDADAGVDEGDCTGAVAALCGDFDEAVAAGQAEITEVWVTEPNSTLVRFHVATAAAGDADTDIDLAFTVTPTNVSLHTGVAEHSFSFSIADTAPDENAPDNTTVARNATDDTVLEITIPRADLQAVGGDSIIDIVVTATHEETQSNDQSDPLDATRTDTTTDQAPDDPEADPSRPFNLTRPPIVPDLELEFLGGSITQVIDGTMNTTSFPNNQVTSEGPNATVTFDLVLENTGSDPDNATIEFFDPTGSLAADNVIVTISPDTTPRILPGEMVNVTVTATLTNASVGDHAILLQATSGRGAIAGNAVQVTVPAPPPPPDDNGDNGNGGNNGNNNGGTQEPAGREPIPAGLSFLSPMAEGLGLDGPFGDYAELVLLAILLLLVILIVFLIVFFATRGAVAIDVEPRTVTARPGETAEFSVSVRNKRGRPMRAVTHFEGDPAWRTGLAFGDAQLTQSHTDAQLGLGPKDRDSGTRMGKLRVTVPAEAHDDETDQITLAVSALNDAGEPVKTRTANVKVRAAGGAAPVVQRGDLPMRLASVQHNPEEPMAGDTVETTARLENDSDTDTMQLRVVLNVGGEDIQEQNVVLPPRNARAVVFHWEAPQGSSKVKVRVYPQD